MIIFTQHALLKLRQRNIKKILVVKALKNPDKIFQSYNNRIIALKKFRKIYLKVIFRKESKDIIVITQHWVEKINL